jgi:hypothetical protein
MRALYRAPDDTKFRQLLVPNDLHTLQELVGGYIETVTVQVNPQVIVICNEEARLKRLPYNCTIEGKDYTGEFDCPFFGPILLVGVDGDEFTDVPISVVMANKMIVEG